MATTIKYTDCIYPDSQAVNALYYDASMFNLYVVFNNGRLAGYKGVSEFTWGDLVKESKHGSVGRFYNKYIQGKYNGLSVDQDTHFEPKAQQQEAPKPEPKPEHTFSITVDFTQKFDIEATSLEEALRAVKKAIDNANIVESYEIKKAEVMF